MHLTKDIQPVKYASRPKALFKLKNLKVNPLFKNQKKKVQQSYHNNAVRPLRKDRGANEPPRVQTVNVGNMVGN